MTNTLAQTFVLEDGKNKVTKICSIVVDPYLYSYIGVKK